jgi:GNAT superfamily N-acetyltransferase
MATINKNLERMIKLADEFFEAKNDPMQISVDAETMAALKRIHPSTMGEMTTEDGPVAWVLVIPTTEKLMREFISKKINEHQLLQKTLPGVKYDALYLCSALVLPEERGKGLATRLLIKSITSIKKKHSIKYLFYWGFSLEGKILASAVAKEFALPLFAREA